ncbi:DP1 DNA binding protein [Cryptosporidium ubiquitum]|uniref:DP1 DNA binding protein n=1 Tax=Cryptosporidium ubiquitum TaxID=857276 RepID=A0A1J4MKW0_9CRYT|nr:DP1 DNA binding protein [Cryptosporidium ubiquitum]OII74906.1 DP1 DNA binding protein [Cryptosporidium ubiquitum]
MDYSGNLNGYINQVSTTDGLPTSTVGNADYTFEMLTTETDSVHSNQYNADIRNNSLPYVGMLGYSSAKGTLKQVAVRICTLLKVWRISTQTDIADNLIIECLGPIDSIRAANDPIYQKNRESSEKSIRRRVYDAINVLISAKILDKSNKNIIWKGISSINHILCSDNAQPCDNLPLIQQNIREKLVEYERLQYLYLSLKTIIEHNASTKSMNNEQKSLLPCSLVIANSKDSNISCIYRNNKSEVAIQVNSIVDFLDQYEIINRVAACIRMTTVDTSQLV